jgi:pimeloyl-ACP methyl ester carboxylesterase
MKPISTENQRSVINIHEFGAENQEILLMFHGACMVWDMYDEAIKTLSRNFHVIIPALPGHDMETNSDYSSVERIATQMENWLLERKYDIIDCLYGFSMGGGIALRFLADRRVTVHHAMIDGGITPYHLPWLLTRVIAVRDYFMIQIGRSSKKILEYAFPPEKYTREGVDYFYKVLRHMSSKSIWRVFESANNYSMPNPIPNIPAEIEYCYGEKERRAREWNIAYMKKKFPEARFRLIPGMDHGEYCLMHQKDFANDVMAFIWNQSMT